MNYPGHVIKKGSSESDIVKAIQEQLNSRGCGPVTVNGSFDDTTENAVKLFQTRFVDQNNNPLKSDGKVGPISWASLFGLTTIASITTTSNDLLKKVLQVAVSQIGVMEEPVGSNNGTMVNKYQDAAGSPHGQAWCMAFIYYCFKEAATALGRSNPAVKTGSVMDHWNRATCKKITAARAKQNTSLVLPGQVFIISTGGGHGHTGLIEAVDGGLLTTIEGNTNDDGSREGIGVFRRKKRTISSINTGFLEYQ